MRRMHRLLAVTVAALLLMTGAACAQEGSRGALYRVQNGSATVYLLGSIHIGSPEMYPFGEAIEQAMASSDTFYFECDTSSGDSFVEMQNRMMLGEGESVEALLGAERWASVQEACRKLGLPDTSLAWLKPWAIVNNLSVFASAEQMGVDSYNEAIKLGVDQAVMQYGNEHGKAFGYLETLDDQLSLMESFSEPLVSYLIDDAVNTILHPETTQEAPCADWPEWWRDGNADAFATQYNAITSTQSEQGYADVAQEYHTALLTNRNRRMAENLDLLLQRGEGMSFVTVGILHLVLPGDSVLSELETMGYTVDCLSNP